MKQVLTIVAISVLLLSIDAYAEPLGTAFTYQGELRQAGALAEGEFDFQFDLFDVLDGGISVSTTVQLEDVVVHEGIFSVELDFGTDVFDGRQLWLEIGAREGDSVGGYSTLTPRQKLTATPYAISSFSVAGASQPERQFVGYSTDRFPDPNPDHMWLAGPQLCKSTFGSTATMATSREVLRAINDGTFFQPSGSYAAVIRPVDLIANPATNNWFDSNLNIQLPFTSAIFVGREGFPVFSYTSDDVHNFLVTCSR